MVGISEPRMIGRRWTARLKKVTTIQMSSDAVSRYVTSAPSFANWRDIPEDASRRKVRSKIM